jgi:calpain-15
MPGVRIMKLSSSCGWVLVGENSTEDMFLNVTVDANESQNMLSTRGTLITHDSVPPLHRQVIWYKL